MWTLTIFISVYIMNKMYKATGGVSKHDEKESKNIFVLPSFIFSPAFRSVVLSMKYRGSAIQFYTKILMLSKYTEWMLVFFCLFKLCFLCWSFRVGKVSKYIFDSFNVNKALHNKLVEHVNCSQCKERALMPQASFRNAPLSCDAVASCLPISLD